MSLNQYSYVWYTFHLTLKYSSCKRSPFCNCSTGLSMTIFTIHVSFSVSPYQAHLQWVIVDSLPFALLKLYASSMIKSFFLFYLLSVYLFWFWKGSAIVYLILLKNLKILHVSDSWVYNFYHLLRTLLLTQLPYWSL